MQTAALTALPAVEMARLISRREISPVELVDAHLARIEALNPTLNAFVFVDVDGARRQARVAEAAVLRRHSLGPLHGVPLSIKSSVSVAGMPWETGSRVPPRRPRRNRRHARTARTRGRRHHPRRHQRRRAVDGVGDGQRALRAHQQPMGYGANAGRIERRRVGGDRRGTLCRRRRQRRRRIDPRPGALHRDRRAEAHSWTRAGDRTLPSLRRPLRAHRCRRADGSHRGRRRAAAVGDGRTGHRRSERASGAAGFAAGGGRRAAGDRHHQSGSDRQPQPPAHRESAGSKTMGGRRCNRKSATRSGAPPTRCRARDSRWLPSVPRGSSEARELWWDIFGRASRLLLGAARGRTRSRGARQPAAVPRVDATDADAHRRAVARMSRSSGTCCVRASCSRWRSSRSCSVL